MKLALLIVLSVAAGIKCVGDAIGSSSSTAYPNPASKELKDSYVPVEENDSCGRRKIKQSDLAANGGDPKSGYWPWNVNVKKLDRKAYVDVCAGTLLTKSWVMTAAHCVAVDGFVWKPYFFLITLGDYFSYGHELSDVVVHDDLKFQPLKNDIALLKLKSEVTFDAYIQPACLWNDKISEKLSPGDVYGNVVGWDYNGKNDPPAKLRHVTLPMVPEATCIKSDPVFYTSIIDDRKFCAGLSNDTANWYGDSGGGFFVFVPDDKSQESDEDKSGIWYVRGILSQSPSTDPGSPVTQQYAVFTDVAKYYQWIQKYIS